LEFVAVEMLLQHLYAPGFFLSCPAPCCGYFYYELQYAARQYAWQEQRRQLLILQQRQLLILQQRQLLILQQRQHARQNQHQQSPFSFLWLYFLSPFVK
jgi:hypothetical protein